MEKEGRRDGMRGKGLRGIVLSFDLMLALLLAGIALAAAAHYFALPARHSQEGTTLRNYLQDAATVMSNAGHLEEPVSFRTKGSTIGIRETMRMLPASVCMQVEAYGLAAGEGLVGYWPMDLVSGDALWDLSGNGNAGSIHGNTQASGTGRAGNAIALNGADQYAGFGAGPAFNLTGTQMAISAWFNTNSTHAQTVASKGESYSLRVADGEVVCTAGQATASHPVPFSEFSGWHHAACSADGAVLALYLDGKEEASAPLAGNIGENGMEFRIGSMQGQFGTAEPFRGLIDDVRLYERGISAQEAEGLYLNPGSLLYAVSREGCSFGGGEWQVLAAPFSSSENQERAGHYSAVLKAWFRSA